MRTIVFSLLCLGCSTLPQRPVVEMGDIDYPADQIIESMSDGTGTPLRQPLSMYDKATCFRSDNGAWEAWKVYVKELEDYAGTCQAAKGAQ